MKKLLIVGFAFICLTSCQKSEKTTETEILDSKMDSTQKLRHVVLFKFNDSSSADDIAKIEKAFLNLPSEIPQIKSIEWGTNNSPEGLNEGLTHCFFLTFASEEDRDIYLPHPAHKAFGEMLGGHLEKVTVVDYWVK